MVEINGDNTFYPNRVTFWFYADGHHSVSDALFHLISNLSEAWRMSLGDLIFFLPIRLRFDRFFVSLLTDFFKNQEIRQKTPISALVFGMIIRFTGEINNTMSKSCLCHLQNTPEFYL
jgi:hypothetical protein